MLFLVVVLAFWLPADSVHADLFEPFSTSNLNPFVQLYGLPGTRSAILTRKGDFDLKLTTEIANNFTNSTEGSETILIDGETSRTSFSLSYGLSENWEVGMDLPLIRHSGGSLDGFIENWHSLFGLPNGGRKRARDDQLVYAWKDGARDIVDHRRSASGIGDATLHAAYSWHAHNRHTWALRAGVKLPTGDPDKLTGSGSTDFFGSIHVTTDQVFNNPKLRFHSNVGFLHLGDGEVAEDANKDWVTFGSATITWQLWQRISLKSQLDFNSSFYESDLKETGDFSTQLIIGGSIRFGETTFVDIAVVEDVITDTAPDVVFHLALRTIL